MRKRIEWEEAVIPRVLVINDDLSVGAAMQLMLTSHGYYAAHAVGTDVGIKLISSSKFDLVIVDSAVARADGPEIIEDIRRWDPRLSIVSMSGFRSRNSPSRASESLRIAVEIGAMACLSKPFA